jgi:uncharacterized membrane protein YphA (DoxX/SURF4 family)
VADCPGPEKTVELMGPIGRPATVGEFFGGVGPVAGFLTRSSVASLVGVMLGAVSVVYG